MDFAGAAAVDVVDSLAPESLAPDPSLELDSLELDESLEPASFEPEPSLELDSLASPSLEVDDSVELDPLAPLFDELDARESVLYQPLPLKTIPTG